MKLGLFAFVLVLSAAFVFGQDQRSPASPRAAPVAADATSSDQHESKTTAKAPTPDLTAGADGKLTQQQMQELFRVVADKDLENQKREREYTYIDREVQNKLDGNGQTKSTEVKTFEIIDIYGEHV